jgi:hypothetical protein
MFRPGLQFRLFPVGDNQGGMLLAPDVRAWTFGSAALWQLGGRVGGRIPTHSGFDVDVSLAAFHTFADPGDGESDPQDGLLAVVSVTADVWLVWRF